MICLLLSIRIIKVITLIIVIRVVLGLALAIIKVIIAIAFALKAITLKILHLLIIRLLFTREVLLICHCVQQLLPSEMLLLAGRPTILRAIGVLLVMFLGVCGAGLALLRLLVIRLARTVLLPLAEGLLLLVKLRVLRRLLLTLCEPLSAIQRRIIALFLIVLLLCGWGLDRLIVIEGLLGGVAVAAVGVGVLLAALVVRVRTVVRVQEGAIVLRQLLGARVALFLIEVLLLFCVLDFLGWRLAGRTLLKAVLLGGALRGGGNNVIGDFGVGLLVGEFLVPLQLLLGRFLGVLLRLVVIFAFVSFRPVLLLRDLLLLQFFPPFVVPPLVFAVVRGQLRQVRLAARW